MALISTIADDMDDGARAAFWSDDASGTGVTSESGGVMIATPPSNDATVSTAGYITTTTYDLTGCRVFVRVPQVVANNASLSTNLVLMNAGDTDRIQLRYLSGNLDCLQRVASVTTTPATTTYSATTHQWWGIRESGGTTFWESSPDGRIWTTLFSVANPITVTALKVVLRGASSGSVASPGVARFDNFNLKPVFPQRMALCGIGAP